MKDQPEQYPRDTSAFRSEDALQTHLLNGVSRTFALTITQLPPGVRTVVSNAYLLCRMMDTIEDEPALSTQQKQYFGDRFVNVVAGCCAPKEFASELAPLLSQASIPAEHELARAIPQIMRITHGFNERQREALEYCVRGMCQGMLEFQKSRSSYGLVDLAHLDRYCYCVAGLVGEMLTQLFCDYSPAIAQHREPLSKLAVSFGQGLQMTNILKDIWEDQRRGACWLPQDVFAELGFDLRELSPKQHRDSFGRGLSRLVGIAHGHLKDALTYTLLIPKHETGIRHFCLWPIGMALLTLRKINRHCDFTEGRQVKISRHSVKATVIMSRLTVNHDRMLKTLFYLAAIPLPAAESPR